MPRRSIPPAGRVSCAGSIPTATRYLPSGPRTMIGFTRWRSVRTARSSHPGTGPETSVCGTCLLRTTRANRHLMFRKNLIPLLLDSPMSLSQIAGATSEAPKEVIDALAHLAKSLKHTEYELIVEPAECRHCGFEFR